VVGLTFTRARRLGLRVALGPTGHLTIRGPERHAALARELLDRKPEVLALLADLASLEADGTAAYLRDLYADLDFDARQRLETEAAGTDAGGALAGLVLAVEGGDDE
jgi:hypothetical protein